MTNNQDKEPRYITNFFIRNDKHSWFIIPTIVFYYNKGSFFETGITSPSFSLSFRWLKIFMGIHIQKNIYYRESISFSENDINTIVDAITNPPKPNDNLKKGFDDYNLKQNKSL